MSLIPLPEVIYDCRARDGTWCAKLSKDYPKGCPNFPDCPGMCPDLLEIEAKLGPFDWYAVVEEYDIAAHEARMHAKFPAWSRKQCRNPRHWQNGVMKRLREKAHRHINHIMEDVLLDIPEAHGVDVVRTMAKVGIKFEWGLQAKTIRKVMLVGKRRAR